MEKLMSLLEIDKEHLYNIGLTDDILSNDYGLDSDYEDDREIEKPKKKENNRPDNPKKINRLEIKPLMSDDNSYSEAPNDFLFKPPFSLLMIGIKGAGKSTFLGNFLLPYKDYFDIIYVFSPTSKLDVSFKHIQEMLDIESKNIFSKYSERRLSNLMKNIKKQNKGIAQKDKLRTLIVFEDIVDDLPRGISKSVINKLAFNHRHYNVSFIILSQYFKKLPATIRNNATGYCIWGMENQMERKKIFEELSGSLGKGLFEIIYDQVTQEPYQALTINYQQTNPYRYTKNFNETLSNFQQELNKE